MSHSDAAVAEAIRTLVSSSPRSVSPDDVARALAGPEPAKWRLLMKQIRIQALALARAGEIAILRKGKPIEPDDLVGVYRLGRAEPGGEG